ncbi:MAG: hypothetical protein A2039_05165 [Candidatus Melainabacteria bacterium GWA2_34_9]|nr:MAG: hypothetical protein A2039_05165 [Candidatus Melainabacteria bacterium GWA2_34_9]
MDSEIQLMSVEELALFLGISQATIYSYTCSSGKNGGKKRKKFNPEIYRKLGSKILFVKSKVLEHLTNNTILI